MSAQDDALNALVGHSWNKDGGFNDVYGLGLDITFSFSGLQLPYWSPGEMNRKNIIQNTFRDLTPAQKDVFRQATMLWENVANIHFTEAAPYTVSLGNGSTAVGDIVVSGAGLGADTLDRVGFCEFENLNISEHLALFLGSFVTPIYALYLCIIMVFFCQEAVAKSKAPVFELENIAPLCLKDCADFIIKIYADGKVHYHGKKTVSRLRVRQAVRVLGDRYGKIKQSQIAELIETFKSFPLEDIDIAQKRSGDQVGGGVIRYNTATQKLHINFIPFFHVMTTKLNGFLNLEKWICFPKWHIDYGRCLLKYRPKYEGL